MPIEPSRPSDPEYLGDGPATTRGGPAPRRRTAVLALAAVGVVGAAAVGGWAAVSLMSGGSQPAAAVPANALAYVSLDLDPSARQKLEAVRILKKFPALDDELGLDARDDLRRWIFERSGLDSCPGVDYDEDLAPWVGERAAVAVLPATGAKKTPNPVLALQVKDAEKAASSLDAIVACRADTSNGHHEPRPADVGFAVGDGYVLLAQSDTVAQQAVDAAADAALVDDETFQRWTEEAGDPGIVTMYLAPGAPAALVDLRQTMSDYPWMAYGEPGVMPGSTPEEMPEDMWEEMPDGMSGSLADVDPAAPPAMPFMPPGPGMMGGEQMRKLAEDFEGMAAVLRFQDGTVEMELAGGGLPEGTAPAEGTATAVGDLPATTGAALSFAFPEGWLQKSLDSMGDGMPLDRMLADVEAETGLSLPEDAETLLGDSLSVAVDEGLQVGPAISSEDPSAIAAGIRVVGDPAKILPVVEKIKKSLGPDADMLVVEPGDGAVAFGFDKEYVAKLAGRGDLGDDPTFQDAVPDADRASGVVYVNFAAGDAWVERLVEDFAEMAEGGSNPEVHENLDSLEALGISTWVEDGVQRGLFRLTTD